MRTARSRTSGENWFDFLLIAQSSQRKEPPQNPGRFKAIPTQDKIQVLAEWLKVEPEVLRFGSAVRKSAQTHRQRWDEGVGHLERETSDAFLQLPAPQRKLIREVILTFAKVHQGGAAPHDASAGPVHPE